MVCAVLGCKVARAVGVMVRAMVERTEIKWVCIKCKRLESLTV